MKTVTFDENKYKLVPIEPTDEICAAGREPSKTFSWTYAACYTAMIAAAPDALPGVIEHKQQPDFGYCYPECSPTYLAMELKEKDKIIADIIAATIDACASLFDESPNAEQCNQNIASTIRNLNHQDILDGMGK